MRIDSYTSSYSLDRPGRNRADSSYHEIQNEEEVRREQPATGNVSSQGLGTAPLIRRVESTQPDDEVTSDAQLLTAREYVLYEQPISARSARAIASYDSIAMLPRDTGAAQVVGLDFYV
ncbi:MULTISPECIES: hypothetical protein [Pseudomonas]|uniref:Uncharacterized protein n=1 Tax=Pseudomonas luteola TaxID=47886 RepID=A0A2X2ET58_PSELU|nr:MULTISPECIES: hypothetical protein [Pseudomonas]AYN95234.1 hypothetical protein EAW52_15325 [Pseudomonas sp. LTJR-52]ENA32016.1 hypothetical protein HMPREF1487_07449 [Pseudomonas sp. HPB0071]MBA1249284.1 hypothetical protein [Pseudomonas zeshuii]MBF8639086.1 hypothetical protein [Pseudomonas zeshuii]MBW5414599.1 hypothetical protein [Pseudomonas sp. MAG002Y]